ncbi:hypothetical protein [Hydrotalea sp.]|uniref:hypothetical protein n=1 Tax=Hydrotalea sp. TaxID=2881279 RepID=UPI003D0A0AF8
MRTIILFLLYFPLITWAQNQRVYLKLFDETGKLIKGDAFMRGFEGNISILSFSEGGKNSNQFIFSMNITGASADLKRAMQLGIVLKNGLLSVLQMGNSGQLVLGNTVFMENVRVINCTEAMGCNGLLSTQVTLAPAKVGWTYYQTDALGKTTISRKYGFDNESGTQWNNF